ncbi:hypothetical protein EIP91_009288, partial [Steccherinum ochraceum]
MQQSSRYITHEDVGSSIDLAAAKSDILDALYAGVRRVHRHSLSKDSVFIGKAGIVLMDQRVASFPDMNEYIPSETALPTSMKQPTDGGHASFLETS